MSHLSSKADPDRSGKNIEKMMTLWTLYEQILNVYLVKALTNMALCSTPCVAIQSKSYCVYKCNEAYAQEKVYRNLSLKAISTITQKFNGVGSAASLKR